MFLTWNRVFQETNGGLNLVLWLAKPSAFMAMLNVIKMTTLHDRTTIQINERTYRKEKHTNNSYQKVSGL